MTSGPAQDTLGTFAVAAGQTERMRLGSSIVPAFPRHPVSLLGGATVVEQVAPGRLRLGIGTSHHC